MSRKITQQNGFSDDGMRKLERIIRSQLNFAHASISKVLTHCRDEQFDMSISIIHETDDESQVAKVESSPQKIHLNFHDTFHEHEKYKIFILNSCTNLNVLSGDKSICVYGGDSVIIPSWSDFTENSMVRMVATSILINMSDISNNVDLISKLCWRRVSDFNYGNSINRIITGTLSSQDESSSSIYKSAVGAIKNLLQLELNDIELNPSSSPFDINGIMLFIKNNFRDQSFCTSSIADFLSISERMLQYKFSKYNLKPSQIISLERSRAIARYIREYPYAPINAVAFECGFSSIETARKQFKKIFGLTINEYAKKFRCINNSHIIMEDPFLC